MKAYRAYSKHGGRIAATPRAAAEAFFAEFPSARKCNVIAGEMEGPFFSVKFGRASEGEWPSSWKDVTKKTLSDLPGAV